MFKRIWVEVFLILLCFLLILLFSPNSVYEYTPVLNQMFGFLNKVLYTVSGFLIGHIIRKLAFPYINFREEKEWSNNAIIIAVYVMCMFCMAKGG